MLTGMVLSFCWFGNKLFYEAFSLCTYVMKGSPLHFLTTVNIRDNARTTNDAKEDASCSFPSTQPRPDHHGLDETSMSFGHSHRCKDELWEPDKGGGKSRIDEKQSHFSSALPFEAVLEAGVRTYSDINNLVYYYYDLNTATFRLKEEYTKIPNKPYKAVFKKSNQLDASSFQSSLALSGKYVPALCPDGKTYGFSDLSTLRSAIRELSDSYSSAVKIYRDFHGMIQEHMELTMKSSNILVEEPPQSIPQYVKDFLNIVPDPFIICPNAKLQSSIRDQDESIYINAEDITIECDSCIINAKGTHFEFGPLARNVLVKGLALVGATDTSIILRHDGASGVFEDCFFHENLSVHPRGNVVDMNSTSSLEFHRCYIIETMFSSLRWSHDKSAVMLPSFTMRGKDSHGNVGGLRVHNNQS